MQIEITAEQERWVEDAIKSGRFAGPRDAIGYAITQAKLTDLRATIEASINEGGENTLADVEAELEKRSAALAAEGF